MLLAPTLLRFLRKWEVSLQIGPYTGKLARSPATGLLRATNVGRFACAGKRTTRTWRGRQILGPQHNLHQHQPSEQAGAGYDRCHLRGTEIFMHVKQRVYAAVADRQRGE